jgi:hypothetical protein
MRIEVESDTGESGIEKPRRIRLNGRVIEIVEVIDRWPGRDHHYFKVKGDDSNLYIIRLDEARHSWELTMFQSPLAQAFSATHREGQKRGRRMS